MILSSAVGPIALTIIARYLVTAEGVPNLLDFGIAKLLRPGRNPANRNHSNRAAIDDPGVCQPRTGSRRARNNCKRRVSRCGANSLGTDDEHRQISTVRRFVVYTALHLESRPLGSSMHQSIKRRSSSRCLRCRHHRT